MTTPTWHEWLTRWLARYPLKAPPEDQQSAYTRRVMARVRQQEVRLPSRGWGWVPWPTPRLGLALATVGVCAIVLLVTRLHSATPLTPKVLHEEQVLAALGEPVEAISDDLEDALRESDRMQLAQALSTPPTEPVDVDQTWQLLDQLGEDDAQDDSAPSSDQELLEELRRFDEADSAIS